MQISRPKIQKTKKRQFTNFSTFLRSISVIVAHYLNVLHITPHQVLFFRVFVFAGLSLYFFYSDNYIYNLIGLLLIILCSFFDLVDGDLARNHNQVTKMGGFLDVNFDAIVLNSVILIFTLKFFNNGASHIYIIASIMVLYGTIFSSKMTGLFQEKFSIDCGQGSDIIENFLLENQLDILSMIFYRLITPKGFPFSFLSNFRDYLLLGIIFNIMPIAILAFAIAINIRWIILFVMMAFYYAGIDKDNRSIKIFNLLKQSEK